MKAIVLYPVFSRWVRRVKHGGILVNLGDRCFTQQQSGRQPELLISMKFLKQEKGTKMAYLTGCTIHFAL